MEESARAQDADAFQVYEARLGVGATGKTAKRTITLRQGPSLWSFDGHSWRTDAEGKSPHGIISVPKHWNNSQHEGGRASEDAMLLTAWVSEGSHTASLAENTCRSRDVSRSARQDGNDPCS